MKKAKCVARFFIAACVLVSGVVQAQDLQPVRWRFSAIPVSDHKAKLTFTASLDDGWHIYSQFLEEGGPLPTTFTFQPVIIFRCRVKWWKKVHLIKRMMRLS